MCGGVAAEGQIICEHRRIIHILETGDDSFRFKNSSAQTETS